uniref:Uncharacterized protein n=1 Tax=Lepeophtheirus salmonis TaxID=72036 RepID=A0A0K2VAK5_LEPSM
MFNQVCMKIVMEIGCIF